MKALLDTHTFLWAAMSPEKLSAKARSAIREPANDVAISTVSFWEISLKFALGKLSLKGCTPEDLVPLTLEMGIAVATPTPTECATFHKLPKLAHKDPFDRMLIWQCLQRDCALIGHDGAFHEYEALGLKTIW